MKNKILQEFLDSDIIITNKELLIKYIDFCMKNDKREYSDGDNIHLHHILPQAKSCFPKFKNLRNNPWNGVYLSNEDHIVAHSMINEGIYNNSMMYAEDMMKKIAKLPYKDISHIRKNQKNILL